MGIVRFPLRRSGWGWDDIYQAIKEGRKTSEWRDCIDYWLARLLDEGGRHRLLIFRRSFTSPQFTIPPQYYKVKRAWFMVGYPKGSIPRLEADITAIIWHRESNQLEIQVENVVEVLE